MKTLERTSPSDNRQDMDTLRGLALTQIETGTETKPGWVNMDDWLVTIHRVKRILLDPTGRNAMKLSKWRKAAQRAAILDDAFDIEETTEEISFALLDFKQKVEACINDVLAVPLNLLAGMTSYLAASIDQSKEEGQRVLKEEGLSEMESTAVQSEISNLNTLNSVLEFIDYLNCMVANGVSKITDSTIESVTQTFLELIDQVDRTNSQGITSLFTQVSYMFEEIEAQFSNFKLAQHYNGATNRWTY